MSSNNNNSSATYLPFNEHCLLTAPKFLASQKAITTFVRLVQESHNVGTTPIAEKVLASMSGLTQEQKNSAIEAFKELEKKQPSKKPGCQF